MPRLSSALVVRSRQETASLLRLALPICGAQLAQSGMGATDVIMSGRASATDLAAVSVGSSLWMPLMLLITGTLIGLTPIVAQLLGGRRTERIYPYVHQALWLSLVLGVVAALLLWFAVTPIFRLMEVPPRVAELSAAYLAAVAFGMPGVALYQALRAYSDGMNHTRPALWISLIGLGINVPSNYLLIYGGAGLVTLFGDGLPGWLQALPALGAVGCGIATALSMWAMCLAMLLYTRHSRAYVPVILWQKIAWPQRAMIRELLHVGLPIGVAIFVEVTLFTLIALFVASLGEITVAAHQVALNYTSVLFMLPLSLAMALTVRVGNTLGADKPREARFVAWNGMVVCLLIALFNDLILWLTARPVVALYTHNQEVQNLAMSLILLAMIYQVSDSLQVNMAGALRGYKDTRIIMAITLVSYWLVGLGGGHLLGTQGFLGLTGALGVHGYWVGLIVGLTVAALLLGWRLQRISRSVANGRLHVSQS
ncbi:multidrug resistance protein, MATE family [Modicisalibacter ilicicola DSM 19980]|uniref:Multidrug-efflux transporter n=1 Tax=Modicisalibacter ilicicola DSM 19980 TaxID=1121942 RepID=A0A1M4WXK1_9GAMM|nr:MATE family efflux transporter [Halomonas ilicicola]SHE85925.1 multidrug resistance protein, MATE family [Halomonas ilicicola DSM 19980]